MRKAKKITGGVEWLQYKKWPSSYTVPKADNWKGYIKEPSEITKSTEKTEWTVDR